MASKEAPGHGARIRVVRHKRVIAAKVFGVVTYETMRDVRAIVKVHAAQEPSKKALIDLCSAVVVVAPERWRALADEIKADARKDIEVAIVVPREHYREVEDCCVSLAGSGLVRLAFTPDELPLALAWSGLAPEHLQDDRDAETRRNMPWLRPPGAAQGPQSGR